MKYYTCNLKNAKDKFGVYCSQKCRDVAIRKTERQIKQSKERQIESELKKFEGVSKSNE